MHAIKEMHAIGPFGVVEELHAAMCICSLDIKEGHPNASTFYFGIHYSIFVMILKGTLKTRLSFKGPLRYIWYIKSRF